MTVYRTLGALLIVLGFGAAFGASAQVPAALTQDAVEQRIDTVENAQDLDESTRSSLSKQLRRTLGLLETARANTAAAQAFEQARETAPKETSEIRARLEKERQERGEISIDLPQDATAALAEQRLKQEQANMAAVSAKLNELEQKLRSEQTRPTLARERLVQARQQTDELADKLKLPQPADRPALAVEARRWELEAESAAISAEIRMLDQELLSQPTRVELLQAQRDEAAIDLGNIETRVRLLEELVSEKRRTETAEVIAEVDLESLGEVGRHPVVQAVVEKNRELAEVLTTLSDRLDQARKEELEATNQLADIEANFKNARQRLDIAGYSQAIGRVLHEQRRDLPNLRAYRTRSKLRHKEIADAGLRGLRLDDEWRALRTIDTYVDELLVDVPAFERERMEAVLTDMATNRRPLVEKAIDVNKQYQRQLAELEFAEDQLVAVTSRYDAFLAERLLWVRSQQGIGWAEIKALPWELGVILSPKFLADVLKVFLYEATHSPLLMLAILATALLLWKTRAWVEAVRATRKNIGKPSTDSFNETLRAMGYSALLVVSWPLLAGLSGWHLLNSDIATDASKSVGAGLYRLTLGLTFLRAVRVLCIQDGVAQAHFRWSGAAVRRLARQLDQLLLTFLLPGFIAIITFSLNEFGFSTNLGQIAFALMGLGLARFLFKLLAPRRGIAADLRKRQEQAPRLPLRTLWAALGTGLPLVLALLALAGYVSSAGTLLGKMMATLWLVFALVLVHELIQRWLLVIRRRLLLREALERREAARAAREQAEAEHRGGEEGGEVIEELEVDVATLGAETRKLVNVSLVIGAVVSLWGIWSSVLPALNILREVRLWDRVQTVAGEQQYIPVTLADIGLGVVIAFITIMAVRTVPSLLEIILRQRPSITSGSRLAFATLTRYTIGIIGGLMALGTLGADWSKLQWLVAALGVGIGFGLQEIVANFISGLIILVERPVRVGDVVTVGDASGTVSRVQIRATTIRTWDRQELLVPNKEFITGRVLNWSLTDELIRIHFMVGVAYGSDVEKALALIGEIAEDHPEVLEDPAPLVTFEGFGDNSLNLGLRCFVGALRIRLVTITDLHREINRRFNEAGIVIAFPQRDVHLDTSKPLEIRVQQGQAGPRDGEDYSPA